MCATLVSTVMLDLLFSSPFAFIELAVALVAALTIHEFAHAFVADRLGDPTPRMQGRVSFNPLKHLDPLGTLMLLLVGFGWGKPVQFDPYNLKDPRRDTLLISLAGPVSNILMAFLVLLLSPILPFPVVVWQTFFQLNLVLAVFNLIPVHPLDGGKVLSSLLPADLAHEYDAALYQYGWLVLLLLIFPIAGGQSPVFYIVGPGVSILGRALIAIVEAIRQLIGL